VLWFNGVTGLHGAVTDLQDVHGLPQVYTCLQARAVAMALSHAWLIKPHPLLILV
jgi:hypothetical protein